MSPSCDPIFILTSASVAGQRQSTSRCERTEATMSDLRDRLAMALHALDHRRPDPNSKCRPSESNMRDADALMLFVQAAIVEAIADALEQAAQALHDYFTPFHDDPHHLDGAQDAALAAIRIIRDLKPGDDDDT